VVTATEERVATFARRLRLERLLAIVRGEDPDALYRAIEVLASCGISLIEVSLTSTDALPVIKRASEEIGEPAAIGAGTVLTRADADAAYEAGAAFLVTPGLVDWQSHLPLVVGAFTATEIARAMTRRPAAVKLFPASLGGPAYLAALRQPFPNVPFVPVGGVDASAAQIYLERGAVAVGVGSPLVGDAASGGELAQLAKRARALRAAVREVSWSTP
jgi:2-dehydro-3-deoxyphosphogluconate aldolase/(4S)-4-hydroxy-2-oxoglutarate aldolase